MKFLAEHIGEDNLAAMKGPINSYKNRDGSRHEEMRDYLCWAFREAYAGAYPAAQAAARLRALWVESFRDGSGDDRMPGNGEWERMLEFAVGAALDSDPEETRTKMNRTKSAPRKRADGDEKKTTAQLLVELALKNCRFGRTEQGRPFAVELGGPNIVLGMGAKNGRFRTRLAAEFYDLYKKPPNAAALADA